MKKCINEYECPTLGHTLKDNYMCCMSCDNKKTCDDECIECKSSKNVVDVIFEASEKVHNDRTPHRVLAYLVEEVGELAVEVSIAAGVKNREPSVDGIIGETVDVLVCALDLLHVYAPNVTADDLAEIAKKKCGKWLKNEEALANR